jgi:hypothetical protein
VDVLDVGWFEDLGGRRCDGVVCVRLQTTCTVDPGAMGVEGGSRARAYPKQV